MKKINRIIVFSLLILALIINAGCNYSKKWEKEEKSQIQLYLSSIGIGDTVYVLKNSGLYYFEILQGTGLTPATSDSVYIWYKTTLLDGSTIMSNLNDGTPFSFIVGYAPILGLDEAVKYMKAGGKAKVLTPSSLAYGSYGIPGYLSGYTPLLWQIELVEVVQNTKK